MESKMLSDYETYIKGQGLEEEEKKKNMRRKIVVGKKYIYI